MAERIKVLIVDDSAVIRQTLMTELVKDPMIEVVGQATDPYQARDKIVQLSPDVVTLDIEMPRMDGLTFLKKLMHFHPMPVIMFSSLTTAGSQKAMEAFDSGAVDVMAKPTSFTVMPELIHELIAKIKAAARAKLAQNQTAINATATVKPMADYSAKPTKIIALGASTGGVKAIETVIREFPENCPPTIIVQHMPASFTKSFADRLNEFCKVNVKEAEDGDKLEIGKVLVAPGGRHMLLAGTVGNYHVQIKDGPLVSGHKPSVDVMFKSVSKVGGKNVVGVILTGMGSDGAKGMNLMKEAGSINIAQDEASCVVFGMPKEAIAAGGVQHVLPLEKVAAEALKLAK